MIEPSPFEVPEDFAAFWQQAAEEARLVPLDFKRSRHSDFPLPGFTVERIGFRSVGGSVVSGWFAMPENVKRALGFVWVPPYGRESLLPNQYGTRAGFASLSFNLHGEDAFHQEKYHPGRGYMASGLEHPHSSVFRRMLQHVLVGIRVLQAQLEVDEDNIFTMGMSQGAGLSIWAGAWSPIVRAVAADMPFFGNIRSQLTGNVYRYPLKELRDFMDTHPLGTEVANHTLGYLDTATHASFCNKPTLVSFGTKDPSVKEEHARAIFEALPGQKELIRYEWGHDWHPEMVENNAQWLAKHAAGTSIRNI